MTLMPLNLVVNWQVFTILLFIPFLRNLPTCQTRRSTDFHACWFKRRGLAQGCTFLGIFHTAPHLGVKSPQKPQLLGVNRRFQAKLVKSKNVHYYQKYCINFGKGIVVPLIKDKNGDLSNPDNYRAITISPTISDVFELCLLDKYIDLLDSHDLQLGFKKSKGCAVAIFGVKQ